MACASCVLGTSRTLICGLRKNVARELGAKILGLVQGGQGKSYFKNQYYLAMMDLVNSKFCSLPKQQSVPKFRPKLLFTLSFRDKIIEQLDLPRIFREKSLLGTLPDIENKVPSIVYKYPNSIRGKIYNYKKTMQNLEVDAFINNPLLGVCDCANNSLTKFRNPHHGHVITGDLSIIGDNSLRGLLEQGPNFRELPQKIEWWSIVKQLKRELRISVDKWAKLSGVPVEAFSNWLVHCFDLIDRRVSFLKCRIVSRDEEVLKSSQSLKCLSELHDKYVICPIDKTSNNVAFVCKPFYVKTVLTETGLWPDSTSSTYEQATQTKEQIINIQKLFMDLHNISGIDGSKNSLPYIYGIVKMHKNPVKFRFIISSRGCVIKPAAKKATLGMKLCQQDHFRYCRAIKNYTGINRNFICENFQTIVDDLQYLNGLPVTKTVETFDFTSLYTNIVHTDLLNNLYWFIDSAYNGALKKDRDHMSIYKNNANWVKKPKSDTCSFTRENFKKLNKFIIENSFFFTGDKIMRQIIGIPMGCDPAPFYANADLGVCEFHFQERMQKQNYAIAKSLNHTHRYIDDVSPLCDRGNFVKCISEIYRPELTLNKENISTGAASVLEIDITVLNGRFVTGIYDKRDSFGFNVIRYPSTLSNIPSDCIYNVFYSQLTRIYRVCNDLDRFKEACQVLYNRCVQRGGKNRLLYDKFVKFWTKNNSKFDSRVEAVLNFVH